MSELPVGVPSGTIILGSEDRESVDHGLEGEEAEKNGVEDLS